MTPVLRLTLAVMSALASPGVAVAEVCDKVNPGWSPGDPPVGQVGDLLNFFSGLAGGAALAVFAANLLFGRVSLSVISAVLSGVLACFLIVERWASDGVYLAAIREGCVAEPYAVIAVLTVTCGGSAWSAFRRVRWRGRRLP